MTDCHINIIRNSKQLPELSDTNFFHSAELFQILEKTPGCQPYMIVALDTNDNEHAHMLAILWRRGSLFPPYLFSQGRVYGEGVYKKESEKKELFPLMLKAIIRAFHNKLCLYIEFSDMSSKMFGYRSFRQHGFFPVPWMHIHNSLHSKAPEERLSESTLRSISKGYSGGIITREAVGDEEIVAFHRMLRNYYRFKFHRYIPKVEFFISIANSGNAHVYVTMLHNKVVGGSVIVKSGNNAFLWYMASKKKSHPLLHPDILTVWYDIRSAYDENMQHINFMNVGLPFRTNRYRDFILKFGGKPASAYRWFHCTLSWLNRLLSWVYRE